MNIIDNKEQLLETVRVNHDAPFDYWLIYLNDARDHFLINYLGRTLVDNLEKKDTEDKYNTLLLLARRVLGPYAMMLASAEMSINFGDNGHTVTKSDTTAPASDAKIEKASKSLIERAWQSMECLIEYLEENINNFPEWKESRYYKNRQTKYFPSVDIFQDCGLIDINYSRLTFEKLRQLIIRIEKSELKNVISDDTEKFMFEPGEDKENKQKAENLKDKVRAFIGARVGELHTSQTTRVQRSNTSNLEYKAIIRPLYSDDETNNLNYYTKQVDFWKDEIKSTLSDIGIDQSLGKTPWENKDKKIFSAIP